MYVIGLHATCSMVELCNVGYDELIEKGNKQNLIEHIIDMCEEEGLDTRVIIYNTTFKQELVDNLTSQLGFEEVFSYLGNEGTMVKTLMLRL